MEAKRITKTPRWKREYQKQTIEISKANATRIGEVQEYLDATYQDEFTRIGKRRASQNDALDFLFTLVSDLGGIHISDLAADNIMKELNMAMFVVKAKKARR